ncbi:MAG: nickel-dependent hydrogenase large subunit [Actinobacteria bacterium]|nr:nickel-dependent hydrogenase large subunit [Actinomycetota bacterium]MBU1943154.1 nickel-dependent hydrogenase large subunit [Actinomycetota bacterium]MBU2687900.1 nickel-dependent hydrogenase large subunit [Actinomycetota bacterium]
MTTRLSIGPYDSVLRTPLLVETVLEDDQVREATVRYSPGARGVELRFEAASPTDAVALTERICARSSVAHATAFCMAVEDACGLEIEPGAEALRLVLAECERIASHLETVSDVGLAIEDEVAYRLPRRYLPRLRDLFTALAGNPFGFGLLEPGGLRVEAEPQMDSLNRLLGPLRRDSRFVERKLALSRARLGGHSRTVAVSEDEPVASPALRAAGLRRDLRAGETAYGMYSRLPYRPVFSEGGGALDRVRVLMGEVRASIELIEKAMAYENLSPGHRVAAPLRAGNGMGAVEGPEGSIVYRVFLGSEGRIIRVRIGTAAPLVAETAEVSLRRLSFEDVPAALASFGLCAACLEL